MNALAQIHPALRLALPLLFSLALLQPAHAAEPVTMIWKNAATNEAYEVTAPDDRLLSEVKQQVMTEMGLSVLQSPLFAVEQVVVTSTPVRGQFDPVTGLPLVITTENYLLMTESSTLFELELATGDTLRLRQIAEPDEDDPYVDDSGNGGSEDDPVDSDDGSAEETDDAKPVKTGHHRGFNKKYRHHYHGKHHKNGGKYHKSRYFKNRRFG